VHPFGGEHHQRKSHAKDGEEEVKAERRADLAATGGEVADRCSGDGGCH
jgi:hypothetical protein